MGSFSIWHWLIVLLVVVLIFGTKKLRNMGGDVGGAFKEFKNAMNDAKETNETAPAEAKADIPQALIKSEVIKVPATKPKAMTPAKTAVKVKAPAKAVIKVTAKKTATKPVVKTTATKPIAKKPATAKAKTTTKVANK